MKKRIITSIVVAFSLMIGSVQAQKWPDAEDIVAKVETEMNLDKDQFVKVKQIIEKNIEKRRATTQLNMGLTQAQSQPLEDELYHNLSEVLTTSQMSRWNTIVNRMYKELDQTVAVDRDKS